VAKRISQSQIAKELGVSQSLVSLVLNGRRDGISDKSYREIWQVAVANGYAPRGMQPVEVSEPFLRALGQLRVPLLNVYASASGLCHSVTPNEKQSLEQIVDHLVDLGHERFAWLGGNRQLGRHQMRLGALRDCLSSRGLELNEKHVVSVDKGDRQEGFDCAEELMNRVGDDRSNAPTAWICHNGLMARGAFQFALLRGIRIPDEISLAAVDRTRVCTEIRPDLTSASSDPEAIGEEAAKQICKADEPGENRILVDLVIPSEFSEGETSGPVAG